MNKIEATLDALLTRYENLFKDDNQFGLPYAEFDSSWASDCVRHQEDNKSFWKHNPKRNDSLFKDIESALELEFHPDFKAFYTSFWANGICVERADINFSLIQTWNEEDEKLLKENILGHCFAKLKARLPLTMFIACTFGDEVICIDNESGEVVLEKPGRKAHKILSDNLETFLLSLSPSKDLYDS